MNLNIEELESKLIEDKEYKKILELEEIQAYNQEHNARVVDSLRVTNTSITKIIARISFLTAKSTAKTVVELMTYNDLINERLIEIYNRILEIERMSNAGHNEEHAQQMDAEVSELCKEESNLAYQLHKNSSQKQQGILKKGISITEEDTLNTALRTLSIAHGDSGALQNGCMEIARKMVELLLRSHQNGEISSEEFSSKKSAIDDKIKFFNANSAPEFEVAVKQAILKEEEPEFESHFYI